MSVELERLAREWLDANGSPFEDDYSTSANPWLRIAEEAFFKAFCDYRAAARIDDRVVPRHGYWLYRLYDADDRCIYIGVSRNLRRRLADHKRTRGDLFTDVTWEAYDSEADMLDAERRAIRAEMPVLNSQGL